MALGKTYSRGFLVAPTVFGNVIGYSKIVRRDQPTHVSFFCVYLPPVVGKKSQLYGGNSNGMCATLYLAWIEHNL